MKKKTKSSGDESNVDKSKSSGDESNVDKSKYVERKKFRPRCRITYVSSGRLR